mmetsp:Transcript_28948/g.53754  ORF Transcript_28948/g.53754 Transcript_28948/m.53754 type:complete len:221 (-) Transcript_28948:88-750(-)
MQSASGALQQRVLAYEAAVQAPIHARPAAAATANFGATVRAASLIVSPSPPPPGESTVPPSHCMSQSSPRNVPPSTLKQVTLPKPMGAHGSQHEAMWHTISVAASQLSGNWGGSDARPFSFSEARQSATQFCMRLDSMHAPKLLREFSHTGGKVAPSPSRLRRPPLADWLPSVTSLEPWPLEAPPGDSAGSSPSAAKAPSRERAHRTRRRAMRIFPDSKR